MIPGIISGHNEVMSTAPKKRLFAENAPIVTSRYRGPDRRKADSDYPEESVSRQVTFDAKGNPVLDVRTDVPRRRKNDHTIDLLECLDADKLGLKIDED